MKTLDFSPKNLENQRNVVEEEVRVNVLNLPMDFSSRSIFPEKHSTPIPMRTISMVSSRISTPPKSQTSRTFYEQYYAPNNAVLAIVGDVRPRDVFAKVEKYFAAHPRTPTYHPAESGRAAQKSERRSSQDRQVGQSSGDRHWLPHAATAFARRAGRRRNGRATA